MSNSLQPHGLQHVRPPCPSPTPRACSDSCPLSHWCHPTISSSVVHFSSHLQSFPASGSFPKSQFYASGGQSIGASASVLPMNIQDSFPLGWTGLISLLSKGVSRIFSRTTVKLDDREVHYSSNIYFLYVCAKSLQSYLSLCDSMNCSLPHSSVHGILQARILEWVAILFSRGSSRPRDWIWVSCITGRFSTVWATREVHKHSMVDPNNL